MATENITIKIDAKGARRVARAIDNVGKSAEKSQRGVSLLTRSLGLLGGVFLIRKIAEFSDEATNLTNRLKLVTTSTENLRAVQAKLLDIASESRQSFSATAELFTRVALSVDQLGFSQQRVIKFTELFNKTVAISGATQQESRNATIQLAQGLASGQLRGEEFRSVAEQLPGVLQIVEEALGKTRGELREMAFDGQLTSDVVIEAFEKMEDTVQERFLTATPTIGQAFTVVKNEVIGLFAAINQETDAAGSFARAVIAAAKAIRTVGETAIAIFKTLGTLIDAAIMLFEDLLEAVNDLLGGPMSDLNLGFKDLIVLVGFFVDKAVAGFRLIGQALLTGFGGPLSIIAAGVLELLNLIIDGLNKVSKAAGKFGPKKGPATIAKEFEEAGVPLTPLEQTSVAAGDFPVAKSIEFQRRTGRAPGKGGVAIPQIPNIPGSDALINFAKGRGSFKALEEAFAAFASTEPSEALQVLLDNLSSVRSRGGINQQGGPRRRGAGKDDDKAERERIKRIQEMKGAIAELRAETDPTNAALQEMLEVESTLTQAVQAGVVSQEKATDLLNQKKVLLQDQLDPAQARIDQLGQEIFLASELTPKQEQQVELQEILNDLDEQGVTITKDLVEQLQKRLELRDEAAATADVEKRIRAVHDEIAALGALSKEQKRQLEIQTQLREAEGATPESLARLQAAIDMRNALEDQIEFAERLNEGLREAGEALGKVLSDVISGVDRSLQSILARLFQAASSILLNSAIQQLTAPGSTGGQNFLGGILGSLGGALGGFQQGGEFVVGGSGGPDSQLVMFRASPEEHVAVTPKNKQRMQSGAPGGPTEFFFTNVNVTDPREASRAMDTRRGGRVVNNRIRTNRRALNRIMNR